jgi:hypothetical protein
MTREQFLERYEALGEESDFLAAKPRYEHALTDEVVDAPVLNEYGYLLECHGRNELRRAVRLYERAIELDPDYDKPHYQLISARAGLQEPEASVAMYQRRVADAPTEVREHRFLASATWALSTPVRSSWSAKGELLTPPTHGDRSSGGTSLAVSPCRASGRAGSCSASKPQNEQTARRDPLLRGLSEP